MQARAIIVIKTRGYTSKHATSEFLNRSRTQTCCKILTVPSSAAIGMCIMKNAGSSIDAVEAAIKLLEDREITNAGYGSNLAMDGVVECDASIVDHFGRSGAVGAVARMNILTMSLLVLT
jgi:isoaspartyl peptidase/L-asparaginase-like protein (Ntn-hydrolase superfamily)